MYEKEPKKHRMTDITGWWNLNCTGNSGFFQISKLFIINNIIDVNITGNLQHYNTRKVWLILNYD